MGYLIVKASTADGAIPLENAVITIRQDSALTTELITDKNGLTSKTAIETPPKSNSLTPDGGIPFSSVDIIAKKEGYYTNTYRNAPVYPGVTTVQPVNLLPLPGYLVGSPPETDTDFDEGETPDL